MTFAKMHKNKVTRQEKKTFAKIANSKVTRESHFPPRLNVKVTPEVGFRTITHPEVTAAGLSSLLEALGFASGLHRSPGSGPPPGPLPGPPPGPTPGPQGLSQGLLPQFGPSWGYPGAFLGYLGAILGGLGSPGVLWGSIPASLVGVLWGSWRSWFPFGA